MRVDPSIRWRVVEAVAASIVSVAQVGVVAGGGGLWDLVKRLMWTFAGCGLLLTEAVVVCRCHSGVSSSYLSGVRRAGVEMDVVARCGVIEVTCRLGTR